MHGETIKYTDPFFK